MAINMITSQASQQHVHTLRAALGIASSAATQTASSLEEVVAPARGRNETREIKCEWFLDPKQLTSAQRADLEAGTAAVESYWKAVQADAFWCADDQWPMFRCILSALAVRDTLHTIGRSDAMVAPVGVKMVRMRDGRELNVQTIGDPGAPALPTHWNAHMVVQLGDMIFDPSHGQMQRFWNAAPDTAALCRAGKSAEKVSLYEMGKANIVADHCYAHAGFEYRLTYFKLTRSVVRRTSDWGDCPDARPRRRQSLVRSAADLFCTLHPDALDRVAA